MLKLHMRTGSGVKSA